jgi:hypothetical protein
MEITWIMVVPTFLCMCDNCTLLKQCEIGISTAEMKLMRSVAGYIHISKKITECIQFNWNYCGLRMQVDTTFIKSGECMHSQVNEWMYTVTRIVGEPRKRRRNLQS